MRLHAAAFIGKRGVRARHFQRCDFKGAESDRGISLDLGIQAHALSKLGHTVVADALGNFDGRHVQRILKSRADSYDTAILLMVIVGFVRLGHALVDECSGLIHQCRNRCDHVRASSGGLGICGCLFCRRCRLIRLGRVGCRRGTFKRSTVESRLECGRIDEWFENRSRLTECLNDAVVLARAVIAAPHHRLDLAGVRIERDQSCLRFRKIVRILAPFALRRQLLVRELQSLFHGFGGCFLKHRVERRIHAKAVAGKRFFTEVLEQLLANEIDEIRRVGGVDLDWGDFHFSFFGLFKIFVGDRAHRAHRVQNEVAPPLYIVGMPGWRKGSVGSRNDARERCGLRQCQLIQLFSEVGRRSFTESVNAE